MGTPFNEKDVPDLIDQYVHFAAPRFWSDAPCVNGKVKYIEASKNPKVLYINPYGVGYLVRVDIDCYNLTEKIEEDEQHSSH
tara:strand:+ start:717 stop:962 length:246 start_codon:yes stop_codon:yes gene_type:complete